MLRNLFETFKLFASLRNVSRAPRQHLTNFYSRGTKNLRPEKNSATLTVHFSFRKSEISHTLWDPNLCHIGISRRKPKDGKTAQLNSAQVSSRMNLTNIFLPFRRFLFFGRLSVLGKTVELWKKKCCKTSFEAFGFFFSYLFIFSCGLREMRVYFLDVFLCRVVSADLRLCWKVTQR